MYISVSPRLENLKTYTDILEKLNVNIAFGASERSTTENVGRLLYSSLDL
jgi:hypothetical protein